MKKESMALPGRTKTAAKKVAAASLAALLASAVAAPFAGVLESLAAENMNHTAGASEMAEDTPGTGASETEESTAGTSSSQTVTLRICNWEEYIDTGDWDEGDTIDLPSGDIIGQNSMIKDFENWYQETYGGKVKVEYSTFGTNEDLYNMLTLGDTFDLVCPSEYMFMKLISEDRLVPLSDHFFDPSDENNYYIKGVSPYLQNIFETKDINGEPWGKYAAGYMWGITGIVYNPAEVTKEEASTWTILNNSKYLRRVTIKDNVRDCYFAAVGALEHDLLTSEEFVNDPDYSLNLEKVMNDTSPEMISRVQDWLQSMKDNVYSFETDSGKADMITGKVLANYQWSGDAVYTMDQADEDDFKLDFAVPEESTNIYFDGWVMLKSGIGQDKEKQKAAEAFINFVSRPDNAIRNMNYIGYTSFISGGDDPRIFEYLDWNYGAEDDEPDTADYDVSYFFSRDGESGDYVLTVPADQLDRQLSAQYPSTETIQRASIMSYFTPEQNQIANRMWVNVRCYNIHQVPVWGWVLTVGGAAVILWMGIRKFQLARKTKRQ